jgi:hypothetical protein
MNNNMKNFRQTLYNMKDFRGSKFPPGIRNNNPGNLRPGHDWQGMVGENRGFVVFEDICFGIRALCMDIINKYLRGLDSVEKIINVYAPPSENNTKAYVRSVADHLGVKKNDPLKLTRRTVIMFVEAVMIHENGQVVKKAIGDLPGSISACLDLIPGKLLSRLK